jgi:hypothetical protein
LKDNGEREKDDEERKYPDKSRESDDIVVTRVVRGTMNETVRIVKTTFLRSALVRVNN